VVEQPDVWRTVEEILAKARVVAVLGAHVVEHKPAFYVPDYMFQKGYRVFPVNPVFDGRELWGEIFRSYLADLDEPVDVVDVFRNSAAVPEHLDDILAMQPYPRVVWMQLGVRNAGVAERLTGEGIVVIEDRCLLAEHRRWASLQGDDVH